MLIFCLSYFWKFGESSALPSFTRNLYYQYLWIWKRNAFVWGFRNDGIGEGLQKPGCKLAKSSITAFSQRFVNIPRKSSKWKKLKLLHSTKIRMCIMSHHLFVERGMSSSSGKWKSLHSSDLSTIPQSPAFRVYQEVYSHSNGAASHIPSQDIIYL